ncbi:MAG: Rpp14/Pop5 family protein [Promethearchaeota archaeon]
MKIAKKERQRYILFSIIKEDKIKIDQNDILKAVWQSIWRYFGLKEANKIGLWLVELDLQNFYGIIRCSHQTKELIISALTLITEINGEKIIISPIKTSGTIKALNKIKDAIIDINIDY